MAVVEMDHLRQRLPVFLTSTCCNRPRATGYRYRVVPLRWLRSGLILRAR
jgi:hypothetical protein